jgi:hypothetical protein
VSDPDRRHSSGASDYDAIFADIVAHLNDELTEAEQHVKPATDKSGPEADPETNDGSSDTDPPVEPAAGPVDLLNQADQAGHADQVGQPDPGSAPDKGQTSESVNLPAAPVPSQENRPPDNPDPWSVPVPPFLPRQQDPRDPLEDNESDPAPQVWRAHEVEDYEDHFEPPPANPLPAGDLQFWAIIAGMGGGPLLLLYLVFFNRDASNYWILTAIALCVGGFALLVSRMPGNNGDDDDGARL